MADNTKQGPKDITDLKARLGLKKQGGGPAAPGGPTAPGGPGPAAPFAPAPMPGAVAPRPGQAQLPAALAGPSTGPVPAAGYVPPPPGFTPPPEAAPAQPDPRRDPYAAQQAAVAANLASFYGVGGALPGSADEVKGDPIKKPKPWPLIGGAAAAALVMLGIGYSFGSISVSRNDFNITTEHAVKVRDEVDKLEKQVDKVFDAIKGIKLSDRDPPDFAAIEKLADLDFKEPDIPTKLFHTNYFSFEPSVVQQLFTYYTDVIQLSKQIQEHTTRTLKDRDSIDKYVKGNATKKDTGPVGVILDYSQKLPLAQLVELGGIVCPDARQTDCKPEEAKMRFRTALGGDFQVRALKGLPKDVVLPIQQTELQKQVMSGDPNLLAFRDYVRRAAALFQQLTKIREEEKQLIAGLKKRAEAPTMFTLF